MRCSFTTSVRLWLLFCSLVLSIIVITFERVAQTCEPPKSTRFQIYMAYNKIVMLIATRHTVYAWHSPSVDKPEPVKINGGATVQSITRHGDIDLIATEDRLLVRDGATEDVRALMNASLKAFEALGAEIVSVEVPDHDRLADLAIALRGPEGAVGQHPARLRSEDGPHPRPLTRTPEVTDPVAGRPPRRNSVDPRGAGIPRRGRRGNRTSSGSA